MPEKTGAAEPRELLKTALARIMRRLNLQRLEFCLTRVYAVGLLLLLLLMVLHKTYALNVSREWPLLIVAICALVSLEWWRRRRANLFEAAVEADRRLGLKEQLSSGLAFTEPGLVRRKVARTTAPTGTVSSHPVRRRYDRIRLRAWRWIAWALPPRYQTPPWALREANSELVPALVVEAAKRAGRLQPRDILPWRFDWRLNSLLGLEIVTLAFLLTWTGRDLRAADKRAVGVALEVEGKKLEDIAKQHKEYAERNKLKEAAKAAAELQKLGRELQDRRMPKKDALLKLDELNRLLEKMQQEAEQTEDARSLDNLQKLAEALQEEQLSDQRSQELAEALARQDLDQAQQALQQMMKQMEDGKLTEEQKKQLAQDLQKLAKALEKSGASQLAKQLSQMAQKLNAGQLSQLQANAKDLQKMLQNMQLSQEQLQALKELGESLQQSAMDIAQADQECECCEGEGKG